MRRGPLSALAGAALATCAVLAASRPTEATYELARAEGTRCATCHLSVRPHTGTLNETGRYYQQRRSLERAPGLEAPQGETVGGSDAAARSDVVADLPPRTGAQVFAALCAPCHGTRGEGSALAGSFLRTDASGQPLDDIVRAVREGVDGTSMMGFADLLTTKELEAVAGHVVSLTKAR